MATLETPIYLDNEALIRLTMPVSVASLVAIVDRAYNSTIILRKAEDFAQVKTNKGIVYSFEVKLDHSWYLINVNTIIAGIEAILGGKVETEVAIRDSVAKDLFRDLDGGSIGNIAIDAVIKAALFGELD